MILGDTLKSTPLMKMHTLGSDFMPSPTHVWWLEISWYGTNVKSPSSSWVMLSRVLMVRGNV